MDISNIYVHDGRLLRVIEEPKFSRLTMDVELPTNEWSEELVPRQIIFEDVYGYKVLEGFMNSSPTLLDLNVIGQEERWNRVRLDTNVGYREILCSSVKVIEHNHATI
jgi:hypothetical protein